MPEIDEARARRRAEATALLGEPPIYPGIATLVKAMEAEAARAKHQVALHATRLLLKLHEQYADAGDDREEWDAIHEADGVHALAEAVGVTDLPLISNDGAAECIREKLAELEKNDG